MRCRGFAVAGENCDPGWRANNRRAFRAAARGHHRIEMTFRPMSVLAGAILTGIGILAMASRAFL